MFSIIHKMDHELYGLISAGILESQYTGIDGELGRPFGNGRLLLSASGSIVKKREPGSVFKLKDGLHGKTYHPWFINSRLNMPEWDVAVDVNPSSAVTKIRSSDFG